VTASPASAFDADPRGLPPRDVSCTTAADCGYDVTYLVEGKCCRGTCSPHAASGRHLAAVEDFCARAGVAQDGCPIKKCVPFPALACRAGRCALSE
jgi:hypothetical protein